MNKKYFDFEAVIFKNLSYFFYNIRNGGKIFEKKKAFLLSCSLQARTTKIQPVMTKNLNLNNTQLTGVSLMISYIIY